MRLVLASLIGVSLCVPAMAQDDDWEKKRDRFLRPESVVGTRFKQEPETASETDSRQMQQRLAKCVYYDSMEELDTLLANSDFERIDFSATAFEPGEFFDDIDFSRCIGRAMKSSHYKMMVSMNYSTLRNLLVEEAYNHANKRAPVREEGAPLLVADRFAYTRGGPRAQVMAEVSDCISYRRPDLAHEFLDARPGTSKETEALEALYPTLLTCLETDDAGNLSTSMVRRMVADGMWARSYHGAFASDPSNTKGTE